MLKVAVTSHSDYFLILRLFDDPATHSMKHSTSL